MSVDTVSSPLTPLDLPAIRRRAGNAVLSSNPADWINSANDVPALLAECERGRRIEDAAREVFDAPADTVEENLASDKLYSLITKDEK